MYLLDTNIFLEYILRRSRVDEVKDFFQRADLTTLKYQRFFPAHNWCNFPAGT
jgi:predicted nucleic acid-binding protein